MHPREREREKLYNITIVLTGFVGWYYHPANISHVYNLYTSAKPYTSTVNTSLKYQIICDECATQKFKDLPVVALDFRL